MSVPLQLTAIDGPIGRFALVVDAEGRLHRSAFLHDQELLSFRPVCAREGLEVEPGEAFSERVKAQLAEYFEGRRRVFDLELCPRGTPFQLRVWEALCEIPWGETRSYGEIARRVGEPGGSRAVGGANNSNPLPIVVPCHRVVGADGKLVGFGGGLEVKRILLELEKNEHQGELFV